MLYGSCRCLLHVTKDSQLIYGMPMENLSLASAEMLKEY